MYTAGTRRRGPDVSGVNLRILDVLSQTRGRAPLPFGRSLCAGFVPTPEGVCGPAVPLGRVNSFIHFARSCTVRRARRPSTALRSQYDRARRAASYHTTVWSTFLLLAPQRRPEQVVQNGVRMRNGASGAERWWQPAQACRGRVPSAPLSLRQALRASTLPLCTLRSVPRRRSDSQVSLADCTVHRARVTRATYGQIHQGLSCN